MSTIKGTKKIFIAYADNKMAYSLNRIGKQAKALDIFDEVILYTPEMLPKHIRDSKLMQYSYGGGYWAWKPYIIYETLRNNKEGTIVCYVDAGCTLKKGIEWTLYFELMKEYDTLCFHYRDIMPEWEKFGTMYTKIKYWSKKSLLLFLDQYTGINSYRENNKIWGGALFFKGKENQLLNQWMEIVFSHPEVILDPSQEEMQDQYPYFAQHKHDQVVLTALAFVNKDRCLVLPELSETCGVNVAIYASRIRASKKRDYVMEMVKRSIRNMIGDSLFDRIKSILYRKR